MKLTLSEPTFGLKLGSSIIVGAENMFSALQAGFTVLLHDNFFVDFEFYLRLISPSIA